MLVFKNKTFFFISTFILMTVFVAGCSKEDNENKNFNENVNVQEQREPEKTKFDKIKDLFAAEHEKNSEDIELLVTHETDAHVRGSVSFGEGEENRGMFMAAKNDDVWTIVYEGNGAFACSILDQYAFPEEMKEGCYVPVVNTSIVDEVDWRDYSNSVLSYKLSYPGICNIVGVNIDEQIDFICNWQGDATWPRFQISHKDEDFYRPDSGVSVSEWVKKHPDFEIGDPISIAGLETLHFVQNKNNEVDAADYYYFIKGDQLYEVMILHVDGRKDQKLYDKFLNSISFDE